MNPPRKEVTMWYKCGRCPQSNDCIMYVGYTSGRTPDTCPGGGTAKWVPVEEPILDDFRIPRAGRTLDKYGDPIE